MSVIRYVVYDWRANKGFWRPDAKGYTDSLEEAGVYSPQSLPTHAGDCWIAIPYKSAREVQKRLTAIHAVKVEEEKEEDRQRWIQNINEYDGSEACICVQDENNPRCEWCF